MLYKKNQRESWPNQLKKTGNWLDYKTKEQEKYCTDNF
jgi:hypothetical protein